MSDPQQPFTLTPGAADSPVLLHVPHGSRHIPRHVRAGITLDDAALERELDHITDAHTAELAAAAAQIAPTAPWRFVNNLSRLVVDPERFPDEREEMLAVGMGAVYTRTTHRAPLRPGGRQGNAADRGANPTPQHKQEKMTGRARRAPVIRDRRKRPFLENSTACQKS
ncbi:N-formylglutamate amidohydrolase, partial [Streptomyces durocortorensis]|uniref:N-formylglutamate amidohydrolase n=1 Tax=Streptomyces durocortorensis TaxID=2811104 RepID=UPI0027DB1B69